MTEPIELIKEDIKQVRNQLDIEIGKVQLLQQEIKEIKEVAEKQITEKQKEINRLTQPIIENQGYLKKQTAMLEKLEGKIEVITDK